MQDLLQIISGFEDDSKLRELDLLPKNHTEYLDMLFSIVLEMVFPFSSCVKFWEVSLHAWSLLPWQ